MAGAVQLKGMVAVLSVAAVKKLAPLRVELNTGETSGSSDGGVEGETGKVTPSTRAKFAVAPDPAGIATLYSWQRETERVHVESKGSAYCSVPKSWSVVIAGWAGLALTPKPGVSQESGVKEKNGGVLGTGAVEARARDKPESLIPLT